jgi:hypothetical protein
LISGVAERQQAAKFEHSTQNSSDKKYQKLFIVEFVKILITATILTDEFRWPTFFWVDPNKR